MTDQSSSLHCIYSVHTDSVQINACASFQYKNGIFLNDFPGKQQHALVIILFQTDKKAMLSHLSHWVLRRHTLTSLSKLSGVVSQRCYRSVKEIRLLQTEPFPSHFVFSVFSQELCLKLTAERRLEGTFFCAQGENMVFQAAV